MKEFDYKEYARQMRENAVINDYGQIICSPELWEQIASIIESTADVVPKSEVDMSQHLLKDAWENIEKYSELLGELQKSKQDFAREIFEEIDGIIAYDNFPIAHQKLASAFAELKKKYTEGEHDGKP